MGKAKLGAWLKKHMQGSSSKEPTANLPPFLPSPRPRPLTPDSTLDGKLYIDELYPQPATCLLFSKLPLEIRLMIIKKAFGDRKVHVDLTFDYPLLPPPETPPRVWPNHAAIYPQDDYNLKKIHNQPHGQKEWRWGGCVCHHNPPAVGVFKKPGMMRSGLHGLWGDACMRGCRYGEGLFCEWYHGTYPHKCKIGAMGFLLSCRQAYVEGLDVLYASNCITVTSQHLMLYLPQLILPQRLASITKLELRVQGYCIDWPEDWDPGAQNHNLSNLGPILRHVETHCPSLRSLLLCLNVAEYLDAQKFLDSPALPTIDAFYLAMELSDMIVEIPQLLYNAVNTSALPGKQHPLEPRDDRPGENGPSGWARAYGGSKWRCLESLDDNGRRAPQIQWRPIGNYPRPPLQLLNAENANNRVPSKGYWIKDGNPISRIGMSNCGTYGWYAASKRIRGS